MAPNQQDTLVIIFFIKTYLVGNILRGGLSSNNLGCDGQLFFWISNLMPLLDVSEEQGN